jgi:hypothetical protein
MRHVLRGHKRVLEIIHLELPVVHVHLDPKAQVAHHNVQVLHQDRELRAVEIWQDHVLVLFVQVLRRDHNNVLIVHNDHKVDRKVDKAEDLVAHHRHLHIAHKVDHNVLVALVENPVAVDLLPEDQDNVLAAPVEHLEKMPARKRITRVRKHVAKRSTICKLPHLVALLSHAAMEILQLSYVAAHHSRISLKKSAQIPQPLSLFSSI